MNSPGVTRLTNLTGSLAVLFVGLLVFNASCAGSKQPGDNPDQGSGGKPGVDAPIDHPAADVPAADGSGGQPDAEDDQGGPMSTDPRKTLGISCTVDTECRSGFCVDGVCCSNACTGACLSCTVMGSVGQCIPAEIGTDPRDQCPDQGLGTCGTDGVCDGAGACRKYPAGITCQPASCNGATMTLASRCDGNGACVPTASQSCAPFTCDPKGTCRTSCKIDTDCASPNTCSTEGSCGKKPLGSACSGASQCNSGFCEQGTCCGTTCDGTCRSCALPETAGACITVPAGQDPLGQCADSGADTCGTDGTCDGAGACRTYRSGTICVAGACSADSGIASSTRRCDGAGVCQPGTTRSCEGFNCAATGGTCLTACASSSDCATDFFCSGGTCTKKTAGATCNSGAECGTGLCQQGVCCNQQCGGCRACNLANFAGTCTPVLDGQDPLNRCPDAGPDSCGTTGVCDGSGACRLYGNGTTCGPGSCASGRQVSPSRCDGAGGCLPGNARDCAPYVCAASNDVCLDTCSTSSTSPQCSTGNVCVGTSCGKKPTGAACNAGDECASTTCAQGFCCATACTGTCLSCGVPGKEGTCSAVPDGGAEPQSRCPDAGRASCGTDGTCNGKGACRLYNASTECAAATCVNAMLTPARSCTGTGACPAATATACPGAFQCDAAGKDCLHSCTGGQDCVAPNVCIGGVCRKKDLAAPCTVDNECASGKCQQNVCCSSSCTGACRSCNVPGSEGTCNNVPAHGSSANACPDDGQPSCKRNGLCDGAGNCEQYAMGLSCAAASCSGDTIIGASTCTGTGTCQSSGTAQCRPFVCNANGTCKMTCGGDPDCFAPSTCVGGTCIGGKSNGTACAAGVECQSTFCAPQGVCCDVACNGTCESCNQTGSVGTCKSVPAGQPPSPPTQCADLGSSGCGTNGKCDGSGACQKYATGTSCMNSVCDTTGTAPVVGRFTPARTCNATNMCGAGTAILCGNFGCTASACKTSCTADVDCVGTARCFAGQCGGLKGVYFKNTTWAGTPANTRVDANVDLTFGNGSPFPTDATWPVDLFTVRWTGWLTPRFSGTYVLQTFSDDGVSVFLNGTAVGGLDNRMETGGMLLHNSGNITLTKDQPVSIRIDYFENIMFAQIHVRWANINETGAITTFQPIPTARLTPDP